MKSIFLAVVVVCALVVAGISGTLAVFSDEEQVGQNVFAAGTLDLQIGDGNPVSFTAGNIQPGYYEQFVVKVKNIGTLPGNLSVEFSPITNYENGRNEPEIAAGDTTGGNPGPGNGELGQYLEIAMTAHIDGVGTQTLPGMVFPALDDVGGATVSVPVKYGHLEPGEEVNLQVTLRLPIGTGNIVQSDSVEFEIIFHLEQVL